MEKSSVSLTIFSLFTYVIFYLKTYFDWFYIHDSTHTRKQIENVIEMIKNDEPPQRIEKLAGLWKNITNE